MSDIDRVAMAEIISTNSEKWAAVVDSVALLIKDDGLNGVAAYIKKQEDIIDSFDSGENLEVDAFAAMALSTVMSMSVLELWEREAFVEEFSE